jgi:hypothetical protein
MACSALAAMFPPAVPRAWLAHGGGGFGLAGASPGAAPAAAAGALPAHFVPQPETPPPANSSLEVLRNGADRSGVIPFAGRQLALPAGTWKELIIVRVGGTVPGQQVVLARVENGRLTGLIQADAPSAASNAPGVLGNPEICDATNAIVREVAPAAAGQNPMVHECWVLLDTNATSHANRQKIDDVLSRALNRLDEAGAKVPDHMLTLVYIRSDQTGWLRAVLLLPDRAGGTTAAGHRMQNWVRRFAAALHQGFDGRLAADGSAPAGRDPG